MDGDKTPYPTRLLFTVVGVLLSIPLLMGLGYLLFNGFPQGLSLGLLTVPVLWFVPRWWRDARAKRESEKLRRQFDSVVGSGYEN